MLVSIILPVFNGARVLPEAIESIRAQKHPSLEIIAIDDGSTDDSLEILKRYPEVKLLQQENRGVGHARNRAIEYSAGEYLAFIDQDDIWAQDKLSLQLSCLQADSNLGCVLGHIASFIDQDAPPRAKIRNDFIEKNVPGYIPGTWLMPKTSYEKVGPFAEDLQMASDTDWLFRFHETGLKSLMLKEIVLLRRFHETNHSHEDEQSMHELLNILHRSIRRKSSTH